MTSEQLIDDILRREGGAKFTEDPADRGGATKYGVTAATLGAWRQLGRQATRDEVRALTEDEARAIYRERFVAPFIYVPDPLRAMLADWAVTSGTAEPTKALQLSLHQRGVYRGAIDGVLGPLTRAAVLHDPHPRTTYRDVLVARSRFYHRLAIGQDSDVREFLRTHPKTQLTWLNGWNNRTLEFLLT